MAFWTEYSSPSANKGVSVEKLTKFLRKNSNNACSTRKASEILDLIDADGDTTREYQNIRDFTIKSIGRKIRFLKEEIKSIKTNLEIY